MNRWNKFRLQVGGVGLNNSEISYLYRIQHGGNGNLSEEIISSTNVRYSEDENSQMIEGTGPSAFWVRVDNESDFKTIRKQKLASTMKAKGNMYVLDSKIFDKFDSNQF